MLKGSDSSGMTHRGFERELRTPRDAEVEKEATAVSAVHLRLLRRVRVCVVAQPAAVQPATALSTASSSSLSGSLRRRESRTLRR